MAALSYYSNWDSDIITMLDPLTHPPELPPELTSSFPDAWNIDYLLHSNNYFHSDNLNPLQFDYSNEIPPENLTAEAPFSIQQDQLEPFKRQKGCINYEELCSDELFNPCFFNGLAQNPFLTAFQDYPPPLPDFPTAPPPVYGGGSYETKESTAAPPPGTLSAQSIAARQRRRKITEKTHELGKLVPGGQKMNTAEMLQSAHKYIKFLQAQIRFLEFAASNRRGKKEKEEEEEGSFEGVEELQALLLQSPLIQEKLYSSEKCIVPEKLAREISRDDDQIVKDLEA